MSAGAESFGFASPGEAVAAMLARVRSVGTERVGLAHAAGRVLAEAVTADRPSPAADVSAMDGYAVALSGMKPGEWPVADEVKIGREPAAIKAGTVSRIVTGAPIPAGADAVIKRELVEEKGATIVVSAEALASVNPGEAIRRKGENAREGATIVEAGVRIGPSVAGALAQFGRDVVLVHRKVRIGILVTGDELIDTGATPTPWQLRDSNGPSLEALLLPVPWIDAPERTRAPDAPETIRRAAEGLLERCDMLLCTGGVSMGQHDHVPWVIEALGGERVFHRVPQKPGKPVFGAVMKNGTPVLGLPGNPVSVLVTARRMAGPVLERLAGFAACTPPASVLVDPPDARTLGLWWQRLARLTGAGRAELVENMSSGDIAGAARADGFVEIPPGASGPGPWPFYAWAL